MADVVHLHFDDRVATVTLDSPHNRNALSRQLVSELAEAVERVAQSDARALVLSHRGPAFCAGADLKERLGDGAAPDPTPFVDTLKLLMSMPIPTIAAINGATRAGGIGLMASCDLVVVERSVSFALTEVRIGVAPAIIAVPILRRVRPNRIAAAMLTGEVFSAEEARAMGLITHVSDDVEATVAHLCDGIRHGSPAAVAATKRVLGSVGALEADVAFERMVDLSLNMFASDDAQEGMRAFREKRPPDWLA